MDYLTHTPKDPRVAQAVAVMFHLAGYLPGHSRERLVPDGRMSLVIELDGRRRYLYDNESGERRQDCERAWLSGVHSNYITLGDTDSESCLLAVQFAPGGSLPFTHRAATDFVDAVVPAVDVFGGSVLDLREELLGLLDAAARLQRAEAWLEERFDAKYSTRDYVQVALDALQRAPGEVHLTECVEQQGAVSYKHFVEHFRHQVGLAPKSLQRILRFAAVFERLQASSSVNWSELSLELGFSDQAHFIREFRAFSGYRPEEFQKQANDRVNFFPED